MGTWSGDDDGGGVKVIWSVFGGGGEDHATLHCRCCCDFLVCEAWGALFG